MQYTELRQMLIDYMNHGLTMNLKSLINTVLLCTDVSHIQFSKYAAFHYESVNEIKRNSRRTYMDGFLYDKHGVAIFNNSYFYVYNHDNKEIDCIWFSEYNLTSLDRYRNRHGDRIDENDLRINWDNSYVYIVSMNNNLIDSRVIFAPD